MRCKKSSSEIPSDSKIWLNNTINICYSKGTNCLFFTYNISQIENKWSLFLNINKICFLYHKTGKTLNQERGQDKENIRTVHEQLCKELNSLQREYKHVRQVVDALHQDYERSKDFDPLRRYGLLKGMIKRTILHFKLNDDKLPGSASMTGIRSLGNSYKELSFTLELTRRKADLDGESCRI